ncbi:hypothetical protein BLOT_014632 [Blomia tropicalis]|nr:hypothetical protein BLOT_014632 [Blomia tropicalis]
MHYCSYETDSYRFQIIQFLQCWNCTSITYNFLKAKKNAITNLNQHNKSIRFFIVEVRESFEPNSGRPVSIRLSDRLVIRFGCVLWFPFLRLEIKINDSSTNQFDYFILVYR